MADHAPSGALAKALADNTRLRVRLAKQKREAKAASNDQEWHDSWAEVEAENAAREAQLNTALAMTGRGFRSMPCGCLSDKTAQSMDRYKVLRCFHCPLTFGKVDELKAHSLEAHHGLS
jgi:hypothetical protein